MIKLMGFDDFCRFTLTRHSLLAIGINLKVSLFSSIMRCIFLESRFFLVPQHANYFVGGAVELLVF